MARQCRMNDEAHRSEEPADPFRRLDGLGGDGSFGGGERPGGRIDRRQGMAGSLGQELRELGREHIGLDQPQLDAQKQQNQPEHEPLISIHIHHGLVLPSRNCSPGIIPLAATKGTGPCFGRHFSRQTRLAAEKWTSPQPACERQSRLRLTDDPTAGRAGESIRHVSVPRLTLIIESTAAATSSVRRR